MRPGALAVTLVVATVPPAHAGAADDGKVLALMHTHCVMCHAAHPVHESVQEAPKNIRLETVADIRQHAAQVYAQTVQTRAMPLGNRTGMTDDERAMLGRWLKALQ
ncbi:MAG TPA: hypothetical protein VFB29_04635 [Pseudolabrys sp.]|nr:hypothetical protein [Pseudolabrys sp.]